MKRSELFFSFLLLPVDAVAIIASFLIAYVFRIQVDLIPANTDVLLADYLWSGVYLLPVWLIFLALGGMYRADRDRSFLNQLYKIFIFSSAAILLLIVFIFLNKITFFSRLILIYTWILSVIFLFSGRLVVEEIRRFLFRYGIGVHRVICIGANQMTQKIIHRSNADISLGIKIVGVLNGKKTHDKDLKVVGSVDDLEQVIEKHQVDEVILTDMSIPESKISRVIAVCSDKNVILKFIPDIFYLVTSNVENKQLAGLPVMEIKGSPLDGWNRIFKRVFDIVFSIIFAIFALPISSIAALAIKLTSKGPLFYTHKRVGRDGRNFKLYKFRSMYFDKCDFAPGGREWTKNQDPRITPVGRILRKTNIDEFPQLINVFLGDMSLVGPRPEQPVFVEKFQKEIPEYYKRHRAKSGLTGWAQVNGLKGDTSIKERVKYDIFYIENWSIWFDIKILLMTFGLIIKEIFGDKYEYRNHS